MIKLICFIMSVSVLQNIEAQQIDKKTFLGYQWATSNKGSLFENSDTVRIIKLNGKTGRRRVDFVEDLADYYKSDFIILKFAQKKNLDFFSISISNWMISQKKGKYAWEFDVDKQIICLIRDKNIFAKFRVISKKKVSVKSNVSGQPPLISEELLLVKEG